MSEKLTPEALNLIAARFRVLADPLRLMIVQILGSGPRSVNEIVEAAGTSQPNVSRHLRELERSGVLVRRQVKNKAFYSVSDRCVFSMFDTVYESLAKATSEAANFNRKGEFTSL
jgi:DNA-binding transcriptional ArsR family regulator